MKKSKTKKRTLEPFVITFSGFKVVMYPPDCPVQARMNPDHRAWCEQGANPKERPKDYNGSDYQLIAGQILFRDPSGKYRGIEMYTTVAALKQSLGVSTVPSTEVLHDYIQNQW